MRTKATKGKNPHWRFICAGDRTWSWRYADILSNPMPSLEAAIADAAVIAGFDPVSEFWMVTTDGLTTNHRPGEATVDLRADPTPAD